MSFRCLRARDLLFARSGQTLLGPLSVDLEGPGITAVIGSNGAGKTTLLRCLFGLERPNEGRVEFEGSKGFVAQVPVRLARSCLENIAYPLRLRGMRPRPARRAARALAEQFELSSVLTRPALTLSAGQAQRMALARAVSLRPDLLLLDEPCAALDGPATALVETCLKNEVAAGRHILMTTHDIPQARRLASWAIVLHRGQIVERGQAAKVLNAPQHAITQALLAGAVLR